MACGILIPQWKIGPESLGWEYWVQDTRLPENSWAQGVLISENPHEGLHLYLRPGAIQLLTAYNTGHLTQTTSKLRTQTKSSADGLPSDTLKHHLTQSCPSEGGKKKSHLLPPVCRHKSLSIEAYKNHWTNLIHWDKDQNQKKIWPYSLGKGDLKHSNVGKMKRQRNIVQMKEQVKNSQDQINKEEIGKLPEKELIIM